MPVVYHSSVKFILCSGIIAFMVPIEGWWWPHQASSDVIKQRMAKNKHFVFIQLISQQKLHVVLNAEPMRHVFWLAHWANQEMLWLVPVASYWCHYCQERLWEETMGGAIHPGCLLQQDTCSCQRWVTIWLFLLGLVPSSSIVIT